METKYKEKKQSLLNTDLEEYWQLTYQGRKS